MTLRNPRAFYAELRAGILGPVLTAEEAAGTGAILDAMAGLPLSHLAYALATAYHETNATMLPVREAYWLSEAWRKKNLRYWPHYGRGYVQLTWEPNYAKADKKLGLGGSLVKNPDRAMEPEIAAKIMRYGMVEGWFSGDKKGRHTLVRYLPAIASLEEFRSARPIINIHDKDLLIARHALQFQSALITGGWS